MWKLKNYRLGFDWHGLLMVVSFILPYVIWIFIPTKDEVLREGSKTVIIDIIKVATELIMIFLTMFIINETRNKKVMKLFMYILLIPKAFYYICWIILYFGVISKTCVLIVCIAPCITFMLFSLSRKNLMAFSATLAYTICEIVYTTINFIIL